jgi:hypothetical protein
VTAAKGGDSGRTDEPPVIPLPPCPHGDDASHAGLGQAWCLAGREGQVYVTEREARKAAYRATRRAPEVSS